MGENGWPAISRHKQGGLLYREPGIGVGLSRAGKRYFSEWPVERLMYGIVRLHNTGLWDEIIPPGAEWPVHHAAGRAMHETRRPTRGADRKTRIAEGCVAKSIIRRSMPASH